MTKLIITLSLLFQSTTYAQVTLLQKGDLAPYKGYLLTPELELDVRTKITKLPLLETLVIKQQEQIDLMDSRIQIKEDQNNNLSSQLRAAEQISLFNKVAYFTAGFLVFMLLDGVKK